LKAGLSSGIVFPKQGLPIFKLLKPGFSSKAEFEMDKTPIFVDSLLQSKTRFLVYKSIPSETGFCCVWVMYGRGTMLCKPVSARMKNPVSEPFESGFLWSEGDRFLLSFPACFFVGGTHKEEHSGAVELFAMIDNGV
jgi:hypothetical protein